MMYGDRVDFGHTCMRWIAFGAAMTYDWIVGAIGPFEMSEYIGIAGIYGALAVTAPFLAARRSRRWVAGQAT
jgi:hypothetical protein